MRRIALLITVAVAVAMFTAGPAYASTGGSCLQLPASPMLPISLSAASLPLLHLIQIGAAVVVALAVTTAVVVASVVRPSALEGTA